VVLVCHWGCRSALATKVLIKAGTARSAISAA
jgi:rhodanese-related sulfurtransferase